MLELEKHLKYLPASRTWRGIKDQITYEVRWKVRSTLWHGITDVYRAIKLSEDVFI